MTARWGARRREIGLCPRCGGQIGSDGGYLCGKCLARSRFRVRGRKKRGLATPPIRERNPMKAIRRRVRDNAPF